MKTKKKTTVAVPDQFVADPEVARQAEHASNLAKVKAGEKRMKKAVKAAKAPKTVKLKEPAAAPATAGPRDSSKAAQLIEMLKQPGGATLNDICLKFGWQQHTTRAMMSAGGSLRKKYGLVVISEKQAADGARVYSIGG